jgi:ATP-dependent exoDNAse (exonuclease V) alpha subunit
VARLTAERDGLEAEAARGDDRLVTVVGMLADLTPGEATVARGWWRNDSKHGWQFTAVDYRTTLPATHQGIQKCLGSGLIKGVEPVMAARIVAAFGEATLTLIDAEPARLREIPGIGPVRAQRIATAWIEQCHIREVMAALQEFGLSTSLAVRIYKQFGAASGRILSQAPYRLAREVWGIGFKTADTIARALGIAPDAPERLQAGVLHALSAAADQGHTLLPEEDLRSGRFPITRLTHLFRQGAGSGIALNAKRILAGELPRFGGDRSDCFFLQASVHKAQGAEFPGVVIPLLTSHAVMLGRTLLYTGLARARQLVVFVGQSRALRLAVRDWRRDPRHTALEGLLLNTLRFTWPDVTVACGGAASDADALAWNGLLGDPLSGEV